MTPASRGPAIPDTAGPSRVSANAAKPVTSSPPSEDPDPLVAAHRGDQVVAGVGAGVGQEQQDAQLVQRRGGGERQGPDERPRATQPAEHQPHHERAAGQAQRHGAAARQRDRDHPERAGRA